MTRKHLRILLAEDSDDDALLVLNELRRQGHVFESTRVMTAAEFRLLLKTGKFDIILCDYAMPSFEAPDALELLRESGRDIPLVVVSGTIGEDVAVESMRLGAADYLLKNNLTRLGAAVEREVREADSRRLKRLLDLFADGQTEVLEMILNGQPLQRILARVIERLESLSPDEVFCSILLTNAAGTHLECGSAPSLSPGFQEAIGPVPIEVGAGTCGTAAALGDLVVVEDIATDPAWKSRRDVALKHGLHSCWSVPVYSSERDILGSMAIYRRVPHLPEPEELRWVESAAKLVSLAIERSRNSQKLLESEALLRIASKAAHIGGWSVDFPGSRITWSDEVCAIHEMPPGSCPDFDRALEFYAPEYREVIARAFEKCLFDGEPFDEEMQIVTANGRRLWVRTVGEGIRDADGAITRVQGAFQDITEKKLAKEQAEVMAARISTTLESITDSFFILDRGWRFIYLNGQAERLLRRERAELAGRVIWEEFPELDGTAFGSAYRRAVKEDVAVELMEFYPSLGCWFEVRAFPSAEGLAVSFHDVTERLRSQEQLTLLENCVSRINDIVIITEADPLEEPGPRIVFVNDAFERRTGYRRDEVIGRSPRFLQGAETSRESLDEIRSALAQRKPVRTELVNYRKDGEKLWLEIDIVPVTDAGGNVRHLVAVERDISERKKTQAMLKANEIRYLKQRNALIALTRKEARQDGGVLQSFRRITETAAETLDVSRVSIWRYREDRSGIDCVDLYQLETGTHSSSIRLNATDFPAYFKGLSEMELIVADDALTNPQTCEFAENYLIPLGITSMLDAPIHFGNSMEYIICHEHVGPPRQWTADEKTFAIAVANLVSLALEAHERVRAEAEVLKSHQRFQSVAAATNDTIWDWDLLTDLFWWNDGFAHLFGWTARDTEPSVRAWIRQIHPEDRSRVVSGIYAAIEGGKTHWVDEYRFMSNDGSVAHVMDRGQIIRDEEGRGVRMVGGMSDLTNQKQAQFELARSHRALQMLSSCNELLIRASDESVLLSEVCRLAVQVGGYRMAWVGYATENRATGIVPMAHAGEGASELTEIELSLSENDSAGIGPAGHTILTGGEIVCGDVLDDPAFERWRASSRRSGYQSVVCLPLSNEWRTFGVIILFAENLHAAGSDELKLLKQMANDLAFGIQNIRVRAERQRVQEVVLKVAQAVSTAAGEEFFDLLTLNMVEALGADGGGIGKFDAEGSSIHSLSFYLDGRRMEPINYQLAGTPCENVMKGSLCVHARDVKTLFPADETLVEFDVEGYAGIPLFDSNESVCGIMMVFSHQPIEERALVESTLRIFATRAAAEMERQQSDARIREQASLLDMAQDAIIACDLGHVITYWNKSAERLYGWSAGEAVGRTINDFLYRDEDAFAQAFANTRRTGEWVGEMRHVTRSSRDLIIVSRWTLVRDAQGDPNGFLFINTDISEHRKLEQQFLRAQRLESIGTLAGGIAHDLNNILAPISMAIELLKMRIPDDRGTELLDTIAASAKRGADMVGQVLSFARGMEGRRVEIQPRQLITEVEKIMRDTFLKNIRFEVSAGWDLWNVRGDPTQLHQVLMNLCVNARDAVAENGEISITAGNVEIDESFAGMNLESKPGPHIYIEVRDNGEGIPSDIMDKIFDPFFTTKSVGKGTGLGLSTSLAIVKSHGGFIRTTGEPGGGTSFRVYLPAFPELTDAVSPERVELPFGNGEMILVVDDEAFIREITQETLQAFGYQTILATNGQEAVAIYQDQGNVIDAVLTDMMMPGMDGAATIRALTAIDPDVRIIATSGIDSNKDLAQAAGGVTVFLPKPCTAELLLKSLRSLLSRNG
ncbi:MAG: PAS domain S-box protein [Luteolibacter sp.]